MQKELITGGLGFIGSVYVACAAQKGKHCVVIDRDASKKNLLQKLPTVEVIIADLLQREQLIELVAQHKPQVVHHFAAHSAVGIVPDAVFAENVTATANLLAALQACPPLRSTSSLPKTSQKARLRSMPSLVFASSCSVYGSCEGLTDETAALRPISAYAHSKADCEQLLRDAVRDTPLAAVSLRYANVAGAIAGYGEQMKGNTRLIANLVTAALRDKAMTIFGNDFPTPDGTCRRDYVHVRDVVAAHELAADNFQRGRCVSFNVCSGVSHSNLEVVQAVEQASDKRLRLNMAARRKGDPATVQLSNAKAARELGFVPQHSALATIVGDTYRWLQEQGV